MSTSLSSSVTISLIFCWNCAINGCLKGEWLTGGYYQPTPFWKPSPITGRWCMLMICPECGETGFPRCTQQPRISNSADGGVLLFKCDDNRRCRYDCPGCSRHFLMCYRCKFSGPLEKKPSWWVFVCDTVKSHERRYSLN